MNVTSVYNNYNLTGNISFDLIDEIDNQLYGEPLNCSLIGLDTINHGNESILYTNLSIPDNLAVPLYGYAMIFLLLVTAITNIFVVAVLVQPKMRKHPSNIILMAISLTDLLTLITPAGMFIYMFTLGNYKRPIYPISVCFLWNIVSDMLPNLFHTASIWLTVVLAVQRYIMVCRQDSQRWCTTGSAYKAIVWVIVFATIHQGHRVIETFFSPTCIQDNEEIYPACKIEPNTLIYENVADLYYGVYFWFRVVFVHLGPCLALVVINTFLFATLYKTKKTRKQLFSNRKKSKEADRTTLMLIVVVSVFLLTEIPLAIITLLHILNIWINIFAEEDYEFVKSFFIFSNSFIVFMYPVNFAIYCGMSKEFRNTFRRLFCRGISGKSLLLREESTHYTLENGKTNETIL